MAGIPVLFRYYTGIKRDIFDNGFLVGSWDDDARPSTAWSSRPMTKIRGEDGCPVFEALVVFDSSNAGHTFQWGVRLDAPPGRGSWGIQTELNRLSDGSRIREFGLGTIPQTEVYYLAHARRLGAQKHTAPEGAVGVRFACWAPNARNVEVVFADFVPGVFGRESGYIDDAGGGIDTSFVPGGRLRMTKDLADGTWYSEVQPDFSRFQRKLYMFRIEREDGNTVYRTDLYSRHQIGHGSFDPRGQRWNGDFHDVDGVKSCSVVVDPDLVATRFTALFGQEELVSEDEFWRDEFASGRQVTWRLTDLVIYELHVGSLAWNEPRAGNFADAIELLDDLVDLGVNAIELLPVLEFGGTAQWGYATSHFFSLESSAGGRDQLKHFVREAHRRGIAVLMDVVYNHFAHDAERAEWQYDSTDPEHNIYYWYEGSSATYPDPAGGYVDNESTGYCPRYRDEHVRNMFVSSAIALMEEFHVDGFRVDQTTSIHAYAKLHADGTPLDAAKMFGARFLREWARTLRMIRPNIILVAEDHSSWDEIVRPVDDGGIGFDARWYSDFYHHLMGDRHRDAGWARLIWVAGGGGTEPLALDWFAGALEATQYSHVVYHESHDEAGNTGSERSMVTAVRGAEVTDDRRPWAEARCRVAAGLSLLSGGTPMFVMGEEIATDIPLVHDLTTTVNGQVQFRPRPDLVGERNGKGRHMFRFYQDVIALRRACAALRARHIRVIHTHEANRVIAFVRHEYGDRYLVAASLNNEPFLSGYRLQHASLADGVWQEIFNSDALVYGGNNVGNGGGTRVVAGGQIDIVIPANGFVVFRKIG
jgi:1,4-alpha-glucan branching enzyme